MLRADSGAPAHGLIYVNPHDILITQMGTAGMAPRALTTLALFTWFNRFNRAHPMSVQLESMKIAHSLRASQRRMALSLILASALTAQQTRTVSASDYQRATRFLGFNTAPLVYHGAVRPTWIANDQFWYRN